MIIVAPSFSKSFASKFFPVLTETKTRRFFFNSSGLKNVFEMLRFRDLVWKRYGRNTADENGCKLKEKGAHRDFFGLCHFIGRKRNCRG